MLFAKMSKKNLKKIKNGQKNPKKTRKKIAKNSQKTRKNNNFQKQENYKIQK
jgi:hypothetical protein